MAKYLTIALALGASANAAAPAEVKAVDVYSLKTSVLKSLVVQDKIAKTCKVHKKLQQCETLAGDALFCQLLQRSHPDIAAEHCAVKGKAAKPASFLQVTSNKAPEDELAKEMTHDLEMNSRDLSDRQSKVIGCCRRNSGFYLRILSLNRCLDSAQMLTSSLCTTVAARCTMCQKSYWGPVQKTSY